MKPSGWLAAIIAMFSATIAGGAALAAIALSPPSTPAASHAWASLARCVTTIQSSYRTGPDGYSRVHIISGGCQQVQAKALCKTTPTSGTTRYGPSGSATGFTSTAYCIGSEHLAAAFYRVGTTWHRTY